MTRFIHPLGPRPLTLLTAVLLFVAGCAAPGPIGDGTDAEPLKIAFTIKDDLDAFVRSAQPLADALTLAMGRPVQVLPVQDESAAIAAVVSGDAQAASLDGGAAWVAWQTFGLEAIAAETNGDGRTHYVATAWVHADSDITEVADLEGVTSCHTGELKSAGMLMPMGYLVKHGFIDIADLPDDVTSIRKAAERFFQDPVIGGGYVGAFQCLSEGHGDVAFVKDSTWDDHCAPDDAPSWCMPRDAYRQLVAFAEVPSHPFMVASALHATTRDGLTRALVSLDESDAGRAALEDVLQTGQLVAVTTEGHLGSYGELVSHLPGIEDHFAPGAGGR